ncbi:hypothetical protein ACPRNU_13845 [Chromobacterium vaccinii]|uniref:hypothetical protein n=1 Tax=Chromobacterium vaccinii TaxID=1108595 RepID=UPI003C775C1A
MLKSHLFGFIRRSGNSLPFAERIPGKLVVTQKNDATIVAKFETPDASMPAIFERKFLKNFDDLPEEGLPVYVSLTGRGWLDKKGQMSLVVVAYTVFDNERGEKMYREMVDVADHAGQHNRSKILQTLLGPFFGGGQKLSRPVEVAKSEVNHANG